MNTEYIFKNPSNGKYYEKGSRFYSMAYMVRSIDDIKFTTGDNSTTFKFMQDFSNLVNSTN